MIRIVVDSRLRLRTDDVPEWVVERLKDAFTHRNPAYDKAKSMGYWVGNMQRFIQAWRMEGAVLSLPRGGSRVLKELLREGGVEFKFDVQVSDGCAVDYPDHRIVLEPFQREVVEAVMKRQNCIVESGTGSGKTTMAINLISKLGRSTIVMLWSGSLLKQWMERLVDELGMCPSDIGVIGLGKFDVKPLTLAMQQTFHSMIKRGDERLDFLYRYFGVYVGDELQRWGCDSMQACTDPFRAKYRVGLSADYTRNDHKEFLIRDLFGSVAMKVEQEELVRQGVVLDVGVRVVVSRFAAPWYRREFLDNGKPNPDHLNFKRLLDEMTRNEERNRLILDVVEEASKVGGVMVFSHRVEHCQVLDQGCVARGIQSGLMIGTSEWSHAFDVTKSGLKSGRLRVGVGTFESIGQAIDVPAVSRGVMATPVNNNRQRFGQVRGRMCRANRAGSSDAELWYVYDPEVFGLAPIRNLIRWNNDVKVRVGGRWVSGASYLKESKRGFDVGPQGSLDW